MADFAQAFNTNKVAFSENEKTSNLNVKTFQITDCLVREEQTQAGKFNFLVFSLLYDKTKSKEEKMIISLTDDQGNPIPEVTPLWTGYWNKNKGKPVCASLAYEIADAIHTKLGDEEFEQRKAASSGYTKSFFIGAEFDFEVLEGTKDDKEYCILMTQKNKLNGFTKKGEEITTQEEFEEKILGIKPSKPVTKQVTGLTEEEMDNLPF